jgi:carbon storage regulator
MLVLSRKRGEKIVLPEQNVIITVIEVRGEQVRLGITAPDDIPIYRQEIWQRIHELTTPKEGAVEASAS